MSLEGAGWNENGIRARKLIGSIQCHRGPRDARFVPLARGEYVFSFLSPARHDISPFDISSDPAGYNVTTCIPKANVSQTRPPTRYTVATTWT